MITVRTAFGHIDKMPQCIRHRRVMCDDCGLDPFERERPVRDDDPNWRLAQVRLFSRAELDGQEVMDL